MNLKTKAIVNPCSANGKTGRLWPEVLGEITQKAGPIDYELTTGIGDATKVTKNALRDNYKRIIAVGGDGTINEVVNGFFDNDDLLNPEAILSVLPLGTGGDFIKSFSQSKNLDDKIKELQLNRTKKIDVGKLSLVNHDGEKIIRYFINIASFGMGGEVDQRVNRFKLFKKLGGKPTFLLATYATLLFYRNKKIRLRIDDHFDQQLTIRNVAIANGQFFGGGMKIAPFAELDDGIFDIVIIGDLSRSQIVLHTPKIYKGTHLNVTGLTALQGKKIIAESEEEVLLDIDGEAPGRLPATFEVVPKAINLQY